MIEQSSQELPPDKSEIREISLINYKVNELELKLAALEARMPNSNVISHSFWSRAFAIFGHQLSIVLTAYATIFAIALVFGFLGALFKNF